MLECLPLELVVGILRHAAEIFLSTERQTVVALAQTAKLVYNVVAPILYRRIVVTQANINLLGAFFRNLDLSPLVRHLALTAPEWTPPEDVIVRWTQLQSLTGAAAPIQFVLNHLGPVGRMSLTKIQYWNSPLLDNVPPSVTHACIYVGDADNHHSFRAVVGWIDALPALTHVAIELVARNGTREREWPSVALSLDESLVAVLRNKGGRQIQRLSIRLGGKLAEEAFWLAFVDRLRLQTGHSAGDPRIELWRDQRVVTDFEDDVRASIQDAYAGVDVWTESRPLTEV